MKGFVVCREKGVKVVFALRPGPSDPEPSGLGASGMTKSCPSVEFLFCSEGGEGCCGGFEFWGLGAFRGCFRKL